VAVQGLPDGRQPVGFLSVEDPIGTLRQMTGYRAHGDRVSFHLAGAVEQVDDVLVAPGRMALLADDVAASIPDFGLRIVLVGIGAYPTVARAAPRVKPAGWPRHECGGRCGAFIQSPRRPATNAGHPLALPLPTPAPHTCPERRCWAALCPGVLAGGAVRTHLPSTAGPGPGRCGGQCPAVLGL